MAENGSAAEAASVSPKQLWNTARNGVMQQVALSQAFDTLRDMSSNTFIDPSQLDTISVLGQGGYAKVEKAWYTPPGGGQRYEVAVKRLKKELFQHADDLKLFEKEVDLIRKLRHRNIVEFIGAGELSESSECAYVVQEYMGGGTLKQLVTKQMLSPRAKGSYTDSQALDICLEMARGLRYLHRCKPMVIHRDLKLENVLLKTARPVDGVWEVKLADFGLSATVDVKQRTLSMKRTIREADTTAAKVDHENDLEARWTSRVDKSFSNKSFFGKSKSFSAKSNCSADMAPVNFDLTGRTGSLMYMAPEVFRGEPYSEKADVFSFGIMMYEIIHQYIMLNAVSVRGTYEELEEYCARVAAGYRPPLHTYWPEPLKQLIEDCWAPAPLSRPSMEDVVARLELVKSEQLLDKPATSQPICGCVIC